jgi:antitoxin (DNA-binding transcriptional repressor) of toxin-antitoxin stability system
MNSAVEIINTKQLRLDLPRIIRRIGEGQKYLVLHRSRPTFELVPLDSDPRPLPSLARDPLFRLGAIGKSSDGSTAADHDRDLYGA